MIDRHHRDTKTRRRTGSVVCTRLPAGAKVLDEPAQRADRHAHLPGPPARRRSADEVRRPSHFRRAAAAGGGGHLRAGLAHRLARRLSGATPRTGHGAGPDDGPAGRQAPHLGGVHLAGAARSGAGMDGRGHHRPRARRDRASQPGLGARRRLWRLAAGQDQDGRAGHGDPAADPRAGRTPAISLPGAGRALGRAAGGAGLGGGLLPGLPEHAAAGRQGRGFRRGAGRRQRRTGQYVVPGQ